MKFTRLRLSGFKSFVEPTDLLIEPGLTGVVGPNGCGKSNLLEALRWVMGESSYKSMRGSGMDDVIFSGTQQRPSRNMAEVMVTMSNVDRTAPPQYNDSETIEISRRIEREAGSAYRINGKDARARDVQLLFADVSTGSRSPALVRQGQISEIINAKPQARRLILEEAAGITGLHTRRHEAELKLRAAELNLSRVDDVAAQLETQLNSLKRQARQATKYKLVSAEIRKLEAAGLFVAWRDAAELATKDAEALDAATRSLAEHTRAASEKLRTRDELGESLPNLREQETIRAAVLQRISLERSALDDEEKRLENRRRELDGQRKQGAQDLIREQDLLVDTDGVIARLKTEDAALQATIGNDGALRAEAAAALQSVAASLTNAQEAADAANAALSELMAKRNAFGRTIEELKTRVAKFVREETELQNRRQTLMAGLGQSSDGTILVAAVEQSVALVTSHEQATGHAEVSLRVARQMEADKRQAHDDARRKADRLQTEVRTLRNFLQVGGGDLWPALIDALDVKSGLETALGAALGDDIDASADEAAPVHWRGLPALSDVAALPGDAEPLSRFVTAPPALTRRLTHIGVVSKAVGQALQSLLKPGQRLVSREGDVWRWDGFTSAAEAPSAAAKRLTERNRLAGLEIEMQDAAKLADGLRAEFDAARLAVENGVRSERDKREALRIAAAAVEVARRSLATHERQQAERLAQTSALDEALRRTAQSSQEANASFETASTEMASLPGVDGLTHQAQSSRELVNRDRAAYAEARAKHDGLERDALARMNRINAIAEEQKQWLARAEKARNQIGQLEKRVSETTTAYEELAAMPQALADRRHKLMNTLQEAETTRKQAADVLATAENAVRTADQILREAQEVAATAREDHARLGARLESSRQRHEHCTLRITESLQCEPSEILAQAGVEADGLPHGDEIERKLLSLRDDRERLGGVNLRADEEAVDVATQLETLIKEKDDLVQAIAKLRGGISSLNKEGRQRLLDAFGTVNEKFGELFTTLFGGGKAELQLIESDDPLEAGLEIMANPPGKKPTVLSLLSGGEQTLTALSLIFAVFLTNPSPICVLDEVDAPLDDHNVERFCNLLDAMLERTETRFLIITHHALTMARMNRLFGVTMMERGVSQLVSVNLVEAEKLVDAA